MAKTSPHQTQASLVKDDPKEPVRILVSWSPSAAGTEAIDFAAWLARSTNVKIRVVSTLSQPWTATSLNKLSGKYKKWFKKERDKCEAAVRDVLAEAGVTKLQMDKNVSVFVTGPSRPQILTDMAEKFRADVILLGANQSAPKGRFFAGSTADALLHYSPIPLGLSPRGIKLSKHGVTRINFAYTDRGNAEDPALMYAARLANAWRIPLRVVAFSAEGLVDAPLYDSVDVASKLAANWREHSLSMLDRAHDLVTEAFPELEVSTEIGSGSGWGGAVDSLKWKKGDLVCMGSSRQGPIARVFLGSAATELLPYMRVPVLVRPSDSAPIA